MRFDASAHAAVPKGMRFMFTEEELKQLDSLPGEDEEQQEEARTQERRRVQESVSAWKVRTAQAQASKPDLLNLETQACGPAVKF